MNTGRRQKGRVSPSETVRARQGGWAVPGGQWRRGLQAVGVADHFVQRADDLAEFGPVVAFLLPTVQHQLVERAGTVHRRRQPVVLLDGVDDLQKNQLWLMIPLEPVLVLRELHLLTKVLVT